MTESDSEDEAVVPAVEEQQEAEPSEDEESEDDDVPEQPQFIKKLEDVEIIEGSAAKMEVVVDGKHT